MFARRFPILLLSIGAPAFLAGCAAPIEKALRDPSVKKCYVADSTRFISKADYEAMFKSVPSASQSFIECDTTQVESDSGIITIRPTQSYVANKRKSLEVGAVNLLAVTAGVGLTAATNQAGYLWIPFLINWDPYSGVTYRLEYRDAMGKKQREDFPVGVDPWFKGREENRKTLLDHSREEIAQKLFGVKPEPPPPDVRNNRLALDPFPLIFAKRNDAWIFSVHYERLLPYRFALHASAGTNMGFSDESMQRWVYGGPRVFPFYRDHTGLYLGIEPFWGEEKVDAVFPHTMTVGFPVTFGVVSLGRFLVWSFGMGVGPAYQWADANPIGVVSGKTTVIVSTASVGYAF